MLKSVSNSRFRIVFMQKNAATDNIDTFDSESVTNADSSEIASEIAENVFYRDDSLMWLLMMNLLMKVKMKLFQLIAYTNMVLLSIFHVRMEATILLHM